MMNRKKTSKYKFYILNAGENGVRYRSRNTGDDYTSVYHRHRWLGGDSRPIFLPVSDTDYIDLSLCRCCRRQAEQKEHYGGNRLSQWFDNTGFGFAAYSGRMGLALLFAVQVLTSILYGFFDPATKGMLPQVVPKEELTKANSTVASLRIFPVY